MTTLMLLIQFGASLFFNYQSDIISISGNEHTLLKTPFIWPQNMLNEQEERHMVEQQQSQDFINSQQEEEREIYIRSRRSCP